VTRKARTLVAGETVRYDGHVWTVTSIWNTNTEGWRANLSRETLDGTDRCSAFVHDCEVL